MGQSAKGADEMGIYKMGIYKMGICKMGITVISYTHRGRACVLCEHLRLS